MVVRWIAWVNAWPYILGPCELPTKENVNAILTKHGRRPLDDDDEITAITQAGPNYSSEFEWVRQYLPSDYTVLHEMAEVTDPE